MGQRSVLRALGGTGHLVLGAACTLARATPTAQTTACAFGLDLPFIRKQRDRAAQARWAAAKVQSRADPPTGRAPDLAGQLQ
jgi:hypothetical protein